MHLKVIDPDEVTRARRLEDRPVPKSESPLLQKLKQGELPYAYCAWCKEALKARSMLEEHYYTIHHVVLQPSCCVSDHYGKGVATATRELWFLSTDRVFLREGLRHEDARDILGATRTVLEDKTTVWHVKMPEFIELEMEVPSLDCRKKMSQTSMSILMTPLTLSCVSQSRIMNVIGKY